MITQIDLPLLPVIKPSSGSTRRDRFFVGSLPEIIESVAQMPIGFGRTNNRKACDDAWAGGRGLDATIEIMRRGDPARVAKSDALLKKYEDLVPVSRRMRTVADIAGGCPNVGAFLAGSPIAMRRRQRMMDDCAPLAVIIDTTCSSKLERWTLERRGAAILALVRMLAVSRPVTLHVGCSMAAMHDYSAATHIFAQIDTAPMDLARAALVLSDPGFNRGLLYGFGEHLNGLNDDSNWAYEPSGRQMREHGHAVLGRVIAGEEFLYVPGAHAADPICTNPEEWLRKMLVKHGAHDVEDAA